MILKQVFSIIFFLLFNNIKASDINGDEIPTLSIPENKNISEMAIALSNIARGIVTAKTITLLNVDNRKTIAFNEFIMEIHRLELETCIFNESEKFFNFVEENLKGSIEVTVMIFHSPDELIDEVNCVKLKGKNLN